MLSPQALAKAIAVISVAFYIVLYILKLAAPPLFKLLLNSQFLGADIASQVPTLNFFNLIGILIIVAVIGWVFGYLTAYLYNRFQKKAS